MDGPTITTNPYLSGNYAPVRSEDDYELEVDGRVSVRPQGRLLPQRAEPPVRAARPLPLVHRRRHDPRLLRRRRQGRLSQSLCPHAEMASSSTRRARRCSAVSIRERPILRSWARTAASPTPTSSGTRADCWRSRKRTSRSNSIPRSLESRGYVEPYKGRVTAHPKIDPETGEMVWFGYSVGDGWFTKTMSYGVTDAKGAVIRRDDFEAPFSSMVHDFLVTRRHALFPILPLTGDLQRAMRGGPAYAWEPDKGAHVGVMARDAGVETMRWFTTEACYVFHPMNAWEDGDTIFADVMEYPVAPLFPNADGSTPSARPPGWCAGPSISPAASNTIKREPLDDLPGEFPRFDERRAGLSYRHGWFAGRSGGREDGGVRLHRPCRPQDGKTDDLWIRGRRRAGRAGIRAPLRRCAGRRRVGHRRGLSRRRGPQRFRGLRRRRNRSGADRGRQGCRGGFRSASTETGGRRIATSGRLPVFRFGTGLTDLRAERYLCVHDLF